MTFIAAVATGDEAVGDLHRGTEARIQSGDVCWVHHEGRAVAWSATDPFVSSYDDDDVVVVVDGHLHNLLAEDRSPAELLHARYREAGPDLATGLLGDFVAIVLDRTRRALLVCRDPLGVRPWYQSTSGRRHSGATDEATLCRLPWVDDRIDERETLGHLAFASLSRGPTVHRGITTLPPGSTWRCTDAGQSVRPHFSWDIHAEPGTGWDEAAERCRAVLDEAVRCRLRAIGSASTELSGGVDSSAVAGTATLLGSPPLAGRLMFEGQGADERTFSQSAIDLWGLDAVSVPPWVPTDERLTAMANDIARPVPDANFTMFVSLNRAFMAAGHHTTLTGLGGDDVFVAQSIGSRVASAVQLGQWRVLGGLARATFDEPRHAWSQTWRPTLKHFSPRGRRRPPQYVSARAAEDHGLRDMFRRPPRLTGVAAVDERAVNLTSGQLAFVLEARALVADFSGHRNSHPFLDPRVINALYGLDPWFPVRDGHYRALEPAAFADRLPPEIRDRRTKAEFSEVFWPQLLHDEVVDRVTSGPLVERGWLDLTGFGNIVNGAREGRAWAALPLSRAVEVDRWLRHAAA